MCELLTIRKRTSCTSISDADEPELADNVDVASEEQGITADLNEAGEVVGIEILGARQRLGDQGVKCVRLEILDGEGESEPLAVEIART